jgi:hypothetical protein
MVHMVRNLLIFSHSEKLQLIFFVCTLYHTPALPNLVWPRKVFVLETFQGIPRKFLYINPKGLDRN